MFSSFDHADLMNRRWSAERSAASRSVRLWLGDHTTGRHVALSTVQVEDVPHGQIPPYFMELDDREAQGLMDELWRCGIRPNEKQEPPEGAIAAMREHITDLQKFTAEMVYLVKRSIGDKS